MGRFGNLLKRDDWKLEKHVPIIECADKVKKGELFPLKVTVGKDAAYADKTEHHIQWLEVFFHPEGAKLPYRIGKMEFTTHGKSAEGLEDSPAYANRGGILSFKTDKAGVIYASSYCKVHGLWENYRKIEIE